MTSTTTKPVSEKHKAFVGFLILNGLNATKAYKLAYPNCKSSAKENAYVLLTKPHIKAEISRQQAELIKITGYSKEQAHQDLIDDRQLARDQNQPSAAISADSQLIRLYGMDQIADAGDEKRVLDENRLICAGILAAQIVNNRKLIASKEIE